MVGHLSGHAGHIGVFVDLFFVLSGFVLAPQLISGSSTTNKKFIAKRILRFWPTITSVTLFILICERTPFFRNYFGINNHRITSLLAAFFLLQIFYAPSIGVNSPLWSLSVEFFVNLIAVQKPIRYKANNIKMAGAGAILFLLGVAINNYFQLGWLEFQYLLAFGRGLFGFYLGLYIFQIHLKSVRLFSPFRLVAGIILFVLTSILAFENSIFYLIASPSSFIIVYQVVLIQESVFQQKFLSICKYLGKISFGIYVWHYAILQVNLVPTILSSLGIKVSVTGPITVVLEILLALSFSELTLHLVDKPVNRIFRTSMEKL